MTKPQASPNKPRTPKSKPAPPPTPSPETELRAAALAVLSIVDGDKAAPWAYSGNRLRDTAQWSAFRAALNS